MGKKEGDLEFIQSDVNVLPENSGGPLLDSKGNVVGICVYGIGMGLNLNFFIPIQEAIDALNIKFK
ncbi:MAG: trypsin-like peptidase domain-containing protein [Planctomycetota bacterium]|jgi:S1-C subfamily serine protease